MTLTVLGTAHGDSATHLAQAHARALVNRARQATSTTQLHALYEGALAQFERILQLNPSFSPTYVVASLDQVYALVALHRHEEAATIMWALHDRIAQLHDNRYTRYYNAMKGKIAELAASQGEPRP